MIETTKHHFTRQYIDDNGLGIRQVDALLSQGKITTSTAEQFVRDWNRTEHRTLAKLVGHSIFLTIRNSLKGVAA